LVGNDGVASAGRADSAPGWRQSGSNQHIKIDNLHDPANPEYIRLGFPATLGPVEGLVTPPTGRLKSVIGKLARRKQRGVILSWGTHARLLLL